MYRLETEQWDLLADPDYTSRRIKIELNFDAGKAEGLEPEVIAANFVQG